MNILSSIMQLNHLWNELSFGPCLEKIKRMLLLIAEELYPAGSYDCT